VLCTLAAQAGEVATGNQMPSRLSMNVTTPKQTQGTTFGEKVSTGLQSGAGARGAAAAGAAPLVVDCSGEACAIVFPDGSGYRADLQALVLAPLGSAEAPATSGQARAVGHAASAVGQGASLLGGAMPGAGIVSAAVSSVGAHAGGGSGAASASYARTAQPAAAPADAGEVDLSQPLADGQYQLAVVVEKATSGLKDTMKTNVRTAPPRVRIVVGFEVVDGVLKTRHDTAKNSIGNIR
jgi:hypothetical protein